MTTSQHAQPCERRENRPRERGLATLDVLIGMALFALIAVIVIATWQHFRVRAYESGAIEDARSIGRAVLGADGSGSQAFGQRAGQAMESSAGALSLASGGSPSSYPALAEISDPVAETGSTLTDDNRLVDWHVIGRYDYGFCIEHVSDGEVDAFAAYRSDKGGVYAHGRSDGCPDVGGADPEESDPGATTPTPPGGGSTPTTPTTPTTPGGGSTTPPATQEPVVAPANDTCTAAIKVPQPTQADGISSSGDVTNRGATDESSVWFHTWAPISAYSTFAVEGAGGGSLQGARTLTVYRGPDSNNNDQTCPPLAQMSPLGAVNGATPGLSVRTGTGNQNYWVKVSSATSDEVDFRLRLYHHPNTVVRDQYGSAEGLSVNQNQGQTFDHHLSTTLWGTTEAGESPSTGHSTIWYRLNNYYSTATPRYTFSTVSPTNGLKALGSHTIEVFRGGTSAASPGVLVASAQGDGTASVTFDGPNNGQHFMVRVTSKSGRDSGYYRLRLERGAN